MSNAPELTESYLESLARCAPEEMVRLLTSNEMRPGLLTFAAEIAGREIQQSGLVMPAIKHLAKNESSLVREGVACGLAHQRKSSEVVGLLNELARDASEGVRIAANDALEALGEQVAR